MQRLLQRLTVAAAATAETLMQDGCRHNSERRSLIGRRLGVCYNHNYVTVPYTQEKQTNLSNKASAPEHLIRLHGHCEFTDLKYFHFKEK